MRGCFFYVIGNFVPYDVKPSVGTHCGGREICHKCDPPQTEDLASGILFSDIGNCFVSLCPKNTLCVRKRTFAPIDVYRISKLHVRKQEAAGAFSCGILH